MRESKLYLNFLKRNFFLFLVFPLVFLVLVYLQLNSAPTEYQYGRLYEFNYTQQNLSSKIAEADETVSLLRSKNLQDKIQTEPLSVTIFKPGPISIRIQTKSVNQNSAAQDLDKLSNYLTSHYDVKAIGGIDSTQVSPNYLLYYLMSIAVGIFLGLIISLLREYFRKY